MVSANRIRLRFTRKFGFVRVLLFRPGEGGMEDGETWIILCFFSLPGARLSSRVRSWAVSETRISEAQRLTHHRYKQRVEEAFPSPFWLDPGQKSRSWAHRLSTCWLKQSDFWLIYFGRTP